MTFIPSETINGLPRKLVNEVRDLLDQFWRKQPGWGDASVEYYYAEQIIRACWKDTALADTILPTYKQDALDKIAAIKAAQVRNSESAHSEVDETTKAGSMRYWTQFWLSARGRK